MANPIRIVLNDVTPAEWMRWIGPTPAWALRLRMIASKDVACSGLLREPKTAHQLAAELPSHVRGARPTVFQTLP